MGRISTRYTKKEFLEHYQFDDEPELVPQYFHRSYKFYENLLERVPNAVRVGVKPKDAIILHAGISDKTYFTWKKAFEKEVEDGKRDTPLCRLFLPVMKADARLYEKVMGRMMDLIEDGDAETTRFMVKNRLGYNSTRKQEVELSGKEDAPIKFVFTNMTPVDNDEEDVEDV